MRLDRLTGWLDRAPIPDPPIAARDGPVVETYPVARLFILSLEGVQRELPAGVVEKEIVGLCYVVDPRTGGSGLNHVHGDVNSRPKLLARGRDHALKSADAPRS